MDEPSSTTPEERYARHRLIDWWDQERMASARVLVAGAGAIGNEVVKLLALSGIGHILIVDLDVVELSNLTRTVLFRESDIGRSKARAAAERARELNPDLDVGWVHGDVEYELGLGVFRSMDVVIGCLDNLDGRLALNRACYRAGVPWLDGGIEATMARVALYRGGEGACFECSMTPLMWARHNERYSCGGLRNDVPEGKAPTTAITASIAAGYLANEALFVLHAPTGTAKPGLEYGQQLFLTLKPYEMHVNTLAISAECLAHDRWAPVRILGVRPARITTAALLAEVGEPDGVMELGYDLVTSMRCWRCGGTEEVLRPAPKCGLRLTGCPICREESRRPEMISWVDGRSAYANRSLAELGLPDYAVVAIKGAAEVRYVQLSGPYSATALKTGTVSCEKSL